MVVEKSGYEDYVYVGYVEYFGDKGEVVDIGNGWGDGECECG